MSIVKSFAIGNGDMYYIRHGSDNFTIIDCCLPDDRTGSILSELKSQSSGKGVVRFISTHPDQDHLSGLAKLDDEFGLVNVYTVKNQATKDKPTADFERYCQLRDDPKKAFYLSKGCTRRWMNLDNDERKNAGLNVWWPIVSDDDYKSALGDAARGLPPNNISCVLRYSVSEGPSFMWMGDLETDFMEKIQDKVSLPRVDVLFAPHHGRDSGKVPKKWLEEMNPGLVLIGEAPSEYLNYYRGYETMTQNTCGDVLFDCQGNMAHVFVADHAYSPPKGLSDQSLDHEHGLYYIGSLACG